ncbi:MAG: GDP-L-fucose synthase [Pseudomonadales bacterium]
MVKKVFVAGHNGMVGSAICRTLSALPDPPELVTASREELDLTNQLAVNAFFRSNHVDDIYLSAAKVGGIHANNTYPVQFIYQNLMIQANLIHAAHSNDIDKLLFLGSSCIYPKDARQPMAEEALLTGKLESTNEPYAIAKIAGIKLCESYNRQYGRDYRSVMPTNLYGPKDNFHPENSHVIPALIRRVHEAKIDGEKEVIIWGTGRPRREFLHVNDMASACVFVNDLPRDKYQDIVNPMLSHLNVGTGKDISISELARLIVAIIGFEGDISFDDAKPDGTQKKLLDVGKLSSMGWKYSIELDEGIKSTYSWYVQNVLP